MKVVRFAQKSSKSIQIFHLVYQDFGLSDLYRFAGFLVRRTTEFHFEVPPLFFIAVVTY